MCPTKDQAPDVVDLQDEQSPRDMGSRAADVRLAAELKGA
jgi:hypothetical protein